MRSPLFLALGFAPLLAVAAVAPAPPSPDLAGEPAVNFDEGRYRLGYEIYLAAGNLPAAYRVAEKAVRERPADAAWRRRLAEVAQWMGQPETALANWLALARQTGDAAAWAEVGRIAPMLADDEAWLRYQQHEAEIRPGDSKRIAALLSAYERVGRPQEGLTYLATLRKTHDSRALLEAEALLAERVGQDEKALADLDVLVRRYGWQEGWLLRAAGLHYQRGELDQADALLARAEPHMPDSAAGYWQTRAEVARLRGDEGTALAAYGHVHAGSGERELDLINYAALLQGRDPLAAARLQKLAYRRYGKVASANTALYLWVSQNQLPAAEAFLQSLTPAQRTQLEGDAGFHEFRGHLREAQGRWREAMADYAAGRRLEPGRQSLLAAWLSLYIQHASPVELRRLLLEAEAEAADTPSLWPLWAAGWSRLDQPVRALPYQRALYQQAPGNLLAGLAYADTLAAAGLVDAARQLRQGLWQRRGSAVPADPASQQALAQALFILEWQQLPPDAGRQRLRGLIQQERNAQGQVPDWVRDLVLGAAWSSDSPDTLPAAVTSRLPAPGEQPAWSPLLQALADNDKPALDALLAGRLDELPIYDRVEAAQRLDRYDLAASLAFETAALRPDDDEIHRRLQQHVWEDASRVDLSLQRDKQGSLSRQPLRLDIRQHVDGNHSLQAWAETAPLESDPLLLLLPVAAQQRYELGWQQQGDQHEEELALTHLHSLQSVTGLHGRASTQLPAGFSLQARAGWQQYSNLTSGLIVGGMRDFAGFTLGWTVDGRNQLALESEYSLLAAQDGGALGNVLSSTLTYSHRLFSGERDWVLKTGINNTSSGTESLLPGMLLPLVPPGIAPTPAFFVPESYTQFSFALAFGENAEQSYQRGWRSFWDIGLTQDAQTGLGYDYRIGILGRVLGRDRLRFFISGDQGAQGNGEKTQVLNADYRMFY